MRRETINLAGPMPPSFSSSKIKISDEKSEGEKWSASLRPAAYRHPNAGRSEYPKKSPAEMYVKRVPDDDPSLCVICKHNDPKRWVDHRIQECQVLKAPSNQGKLDAGKRWEILEANEVCLSCLSRDHLGKGCPTPAGFCETCQTRHSRDLPCRRRVDAPGRNQRRGNARDNVHPNYSAMNTDRRPCYSRTCPVQISHPSSREKLVGLAIIDDQAGRTCVDPLVDHILKLPRRVKKLTSHGTITIEGESSIRPCHVISGLIVTPLDGQDEIALPEVIMQNEIPDSWDQVPSPEDVSVTPGFEECSHLFPQKDPAWETILLIGRDCMAAQWQEQFYDEKNENTSQMLAKTPLGWTLIGSPTYLTTNRQNHRNKKRRRKRNRNRNRRLRSFQQHVAYIRGSPVFMSSDSPRNGKTPEETPPEEEIENTPQENDEWDELEAMSRDEEEFMRKTVPYTRQREDGMIEIPLPFKFEKPCFPYNRGKALQRTKITLENLRRQNPKIFQSSLDKFQKNLETSTPRFVPVPPELRKPQHGRAY